MASQPQPLHPAVPRTASGATLAAGSPEKGTTRSKPPVRPKPHVLPKPALPAKPSVPPVPRRPELPSAEKLNRLAGPQPYGVGGALSRPLLTHKVPETPNGKGLPSLPVAVLELGSPLTPLTPLRKGPAPFKVTPVPVAAKPERFPGTTVEEILAKMDSRENPESPDRARRAPFCAEPSSRFGSKAFAAFRRQPSGEPESFPAGEAYRPMAGGDGHPVAEMSGSPPAGPSCAGDPHGCWRLPSPHDLSSLQLGALGPPGSPRVPFQPTEPPAPAPGSPEAPPALGDPGSPTLAPGSPESPARLPAVVSAASIQAPGALSSSSSSQLSASHSPGSPHIPGEGSPDSASPPGTPVPPRTAGPPGSPEAAECPGPPSPTPDPPTNAAGTPGSPEPPKFPEGPDSTPAARDRGLQRASELGSWSPGVEQELGGLLSTQPLEPPESGWSPSWSPELPLPSQGVQWAASSPSPLIPEAAGLGISTEGELDAGDLDPCVPHSCQDGGTEGPGSRAAEESPCPGGPVVRPQEEEKEAEWAGSVPRSPLGLAEPGWDLAEPEILVALDPPDAASMSGSAWVPAGDSPGGPGPAEGSSAGPDPHTDPGWLTELLASPGSHTARCAVPEGPEDLLGWSRKDLRSEFGVGSPRHAGTFDWTRDAARDCDWAAQMEQDQEFRTKSSWDGDQDQQDGPFGTAGQDWGSSDRGTERTGEARLGCGDWSGSHGAGESCSQDPGFGDGKARWGTSYSLAVEIDSGKAASSGSYGTGRQQDQEPSWASGYGAGDVEAQDRELAPDWAGEYSSSDGESRGKDFTLGWAGRSSTGDMGTQDREFSPSRPSQDSERRAKDMESQDREFSPSRPAWDSEHCIRDTESQDREFSPSRPARDSKYSAEDTGIQDQEFVPGRAAWPSEHSTRDAQSQESRFGSNRRVWDDKYSMRELKRQDQEFGSSRDTEHQDQEFSPHRPAWPSTRDVEGQESGFGASRPIWRDQYSTRDVESQEREFSPGRPVRDSECCRGRDTESQESEFGANRPVWDDKYRMRDVGTQDQEFSPSRSAWHNEHSTRDTESQDRAFGPSKPSRDSECCSRDMESQDWEFSPSKPSRDSECHNRDMESQDQKFGPSQAAEASECSMKGTESQDREFSPRRPVWNDEHSSRDVESQESGFGTSRVVWGDKYRMKDIGMRDQESSPSRVAWDSKHSAKDTESQESEFRANRPIWDDRYRMRDTESQDWEFGSSRDTEHQDQEFSPHKPAWPSTRDVESQESGFGASKPIWGGQYSMRDTESQEREFGPCRDTESRDQKCGPGRDTENQEREFVPGMDTESQECEFGPGRHTESQEREFVPGQDMESQDCEFDPGRDTVSQEHEFGPGRDMESQEQEFGPGRHTESQEREFVPGQDTESQDCEFDPGRDTESQEHEFGPGRDMESQEQEFGPGRRTESQERDFVPGRDTESQEQEFGPRRLSWAGEHGAARTELVDVLFAVGNDAGPSASGPVSQDPSWGSGATESKDGAEELEAAECHNQFGVTGTERVLDPSCTSVLPDAGGMRKGLLEPLGSWHRHLFSCMGPGDAGAGQTAWDQGLGSPGYGGAAMAEPGWSAELLCNAETKSKEWASTVSAHSQDLGAREQRLGDDASAVDGSPRPSDPSPSSEDRDPLVPDTGSPGAPPDHPDGKRPPGWEGEQEFAFLEAVELLDVGACRSKAMLSRQRHHRAPSLRPDDTAWTFRHCSESSPVTDDEEPRGRRPRTAPASKSPRVPLFPSLSAAAIKAKLRGRNRSAEEGAASGGDSRATPTKDPHVQRSKSCRTPGCSTRGPPLPPRPERPPAPEAPSPHWLQALKLRKKKP
ncbi:182 kDa tankyrase-1-binding protein [Cuculus canorus]|uniref:182 kDa tankyrase-1-binding protein n=1 Tax=Cuculus canorus TaxID=55661 RepID=UPI0023AA23E7|nr:182 kDa tankyrase-1-binding protein [Cuculus canorus]